MELTSQNYDLAASKQAIEVAATLQKFVKEKNLTALIQGKQYPLVEAWQFAGSQLGLYPLCTEIINQSTPDEIKYFAKVEIRMFKDDRVVSNGFAVCSNKEASKRRFDEYAIASMAQTRAVGKAFRNLLAWLMKAAGFEATPAEEMDFRNDIPTASEKKELYKLLNSSNLSDDEIEYAKQAIDSCDNYKLFEKIQIRLTERQKSIHEIQNPSKKDINKHLKNTVQ